MAGRIGRNLLLLFCLVSPGSVWMKKTSEPCASQQTDYGYVCVCSSTYCDTITAPTKLKTGKYYHYTTSETSPGFNLKKGSFEKSQDLSLNSSSEVYVTIDPSTTYQTFSGIGAGFTDSSAYVYSELSTAAQKYLMESFFGTTGIELTFGRVPIGVTDFSLSYYSYDDTDGDVNMTDFALTTFETGTKIPFIQAALSATDRTLNLLATPWTSPSWMKDNDDEQEPGALLPTYHEAFTKYIIKFLEAYTEQGIEFWGFSPLNEIIFAVSANFNMPNVVMLPAQLRAWVRDYLGPMMEEAGYGDIKIIALDDERDYVTWYAEALLSDNETAQYIDGFGIHWYSDTDDNTDILDNFHNKYPGQFILYTEASGTDSTGGGGGGGGFTGGVPTGGGGGGGFTGGVPTGGGGGGGFTGGPPTGGGGGGGGGFTGGFPTGGGGGGGFTGGVPTGGGGGGGFTGGPNPTGGGGGGGGGGGSSGLEMGSWDFAVRYIDSIIQNYQHWSIGYMAWNLCLNTEGGPYLQMSQEAPVIVNTTTGEFYKQPFYYALGHFSKFIYPGSVRVGLTVEDSSVADLFNKNSEYWDSPPTGGTNPTTSPESSSFDGIAATNPDGSRTVIVYNPSSSEVTVVLTDSDAGTISTTVEANSLNTFVYW